MKLLVQAAICKRSLLKRKVPSYSRLLDPLAGGLESKSMPLPIEIGPLHTGVAGPPVDVEGVLPAVGVRLALFVVLNGEGVVLGLGDDPNCKRLITSPTTAAMPAATVQKATERGPRKSRPGVAFISAPS
jgi:hypothetical protein